MNKNKRMTVRQTINEVHKAYDFMEKCSLEAIESTLRDVFGFGETRLARFRETYLDRFGEATATECLRIRSTLKRKQGK